MVTDLPKMEQLIPRVPNDAPTVLHLKFVKNKWETFNKSDRPQHRMLMSALKIFLDFYLCANQLLFFQYGHW